MHSYSLVSIIVRSVFLSVSLACVVPVSRAGEEAGERGDPFARARALSEEAGGQAFVVRVGGVTVSESYAAGGAASRAQRLASGSKSFVGPLALCAEADGLLALDEKASDTLTEWRSDPRLAEVTIRQLLSLESGLPGGTLGRPQSYATSIAVPPTAAPGERFQYGPAPFQAFGEILRRKLAANGKETVETYLRRRLLSPAGLGEMRWIVPERGQPNLPSGALLTAREWAGFGEWIMAGGPGALPADALAVLRKSASCNPGYGLSWWLPARGRIIPSAQGQKTRAARDLPDDTMAAVGLGGQYLVVIPSLKLVAIRLAPLRGGEGFDAAAWLESLVAAARDLTTPARPSGGR